MTVEEREPVWDVGQTSADAPVDAAWSVAKPGDVPSLGRPAPMPGRRAARCSGWSRVCGGDHKARWGSDSSFLSLPELGSAGTSRIFCALVGTGAEHCALSRTLGSLAVHIRLGLQRPSHHAHHLWVSFHGCAREGWSRGDPGSCDPFVAFHHVTWFVSRRGTGSHFPLHCLSAERVVITTPFPALPAPPSWYLMGDKRLGGLRWRALEHTAKQHRSDLAWAPSKWGRGLFGRVVYSNSLCTCLFGLRVCTLNHVPHASGSF